MVGLIESSAHTLEGILSDVRDLARIESGRIELHVEPFELANCLRQTAALFASPARAKGLAFDVKIAPEAHAKVTGAIRAHEAEIGGWRAVILSLTANAMPEHAEASMAAGADGHLTKPIAADKLIAAVMAAEVATNADAADAVSAA
jgi:signal transduction histidine kinase